VDWIGYSSLPGNQFRPAVVVEFLSPKGIIKVQKLPHPPTQHLGGGGERGSDLSGEHGACGRGHEHKGSRGAVVTCVWTQGRPHLRITGKRGERGWESGTTKSEEINTEKIKQITSA